MNIEPAARQAARRSSESSAGRSPGARGMPTAVVLFLVSLLLPMTVYLGPLRLLPHRIYLLIAFLPLVMALLSGRAGRLVLPDYLIAGSTIWAALAVFVSQPGPAVIEPIGILFVEFLGAYLVGRVAIRNAGDFRIFLRVFFGIVLFLLPFAAIEAFLHRNMLREFIPFTGAGIDYQRWGLRRAQTVFAHPILYGVFVSTALGLFWYALQPAAGTFKRVAIAILTFCATFLSLSSGAIVSFAVQSICISWDFLFRRTIPRHWKVLTSGAVLLYITLDALSNRTPFHLLLDYTFSSSTGYYRIVIWRWGIQNVWANPIFGLGLDVGEWERASWMGRSVDNFWLVLAMQYGLPTLFALAFAIFFIARKLTRMSLASPMDRACRTGFLVSLAGIVIAGGTVHYWHAMMAFFTFFVGSGVWMITGGAEGTPRAKTMPVSTLTAATPEAAKEAGDHVHSQRRTWL